MSAIKADVQLHRQDVTGASALATGPQARVASAQLLHDPIAKSLCRSAEILQIRRDEPIGPVRHFNLERAYNSLKPKILAVQDKIAKRDTVAELRGLNSLRPDRINRTLLRREV